MSCTKSTMKDLNRFTDKIENVLNDENGRNYFRIFLEKYNLEDCKKCLKTWEETETLINSQKALSNDPKIFEELMCEIYDLIKNAKKIEELNRSVIEEIIDAKNLKNITNIISALKLLKDEITKTMNREYLVFQRHCVENTMHKYSCFVFSYRIIPYNVI